ncbi:MAG: hypothetical protein N3A72_11705 [bacterium]|nr:hypothetical protein [bacterium]
MDNQKPDNQVITWLFNPFYYLAGGKALIIGLFVMLITGLIAWLSSSHFDGVLDFHFGSNPVPIWLHLVEIFTNWLSLGFVLLIVAKVISKTKYRIVDIFGTQALARFPGLIMALIALLPGYQGLIEKLMTVTPMNVLPIITENIRALIILIGIVLVVLVMLMWMIILMYRGFAVSCNVTGGKAIIGFIIALFIAEVISKIVIIAIGHRYYL